MYSRITSGALLGVSGQPITVEVDIAPGLPSVTMVGSLSSEIKEAKDRVLTALKNSGFQIPAARITINLSPADTHKEGTGFDLPIAIGILQSMDFFKNRDLSSFIFIGELGLNGEIRPVRGVLPIVYGFANQNRTCFVPLHNLAEAALSPNITVYGTDSLTKLVSFLKEEDLTGLYKADASFIKPDVAKKSEQVDFSQVSGQESAKRAAMIGAAGFHSLLLTGPPGAGKSMIASRIPGLLPSLSIQEQLEITSIYSVAGLLPKEKPLITARKMQNPHHSISMTAMVGGGTIPKPGAISLAHRSVLFLDELPEFERRTLDALRQPLEEHIIHLSRASCSVTYPADFMLVCAMNPCPCGHYPDRNKCRCTEVQIQKYLDKISGPILDRIDLCVELKGVRYEDMKTTGNGLSTSSMKQKVLVARELQMHRYQNTPYRYNSELPSAEIRKFCFLDSAEEAFLEDSFSKMDLSARSLHRVLRVSRTIADLDESEQIKKQHLLEALCYRPNAQYWK